MTSWRTIWSPVRTYSRLKPPASSRGRRSPRIITILVCAHGLVGWLVVLRINVALAIFQPYLDLEAGDNHSMKIQVARPGIEPRSSFEAEYCLFRGRRRVAVARYRMICLVLTPQAKSLTTRPPLLPPMVWYYAASIVLVCIKLN